MKYKFGVSCFERPLSPLESRRKARDQIFLYKIVNNHIDSPYLLGKILFHCSKQNLRTKKTFGIPLCKCNYSKNRFLVRACTDFNKFFNSSDIFFDKLGSFKSNVVKICLTCSSDD